VYLSDGYPQATAEIDEYGGDPPVYLSDGYPQATAGRPEDKPSLRVYLSDGYPQATAMTRSEFNVWVSVPERRLPAGHSGGEGGGA